jgi:hypothetical protein
MAMPSRSGLQQVSRDAVQVNQGHCIRAAPARAERLAQSRVAPVGHRPDAKFYSLTRAGQAARGREGVSERSPTPCALIFNEGLVPWQGFSTCSPAPPPMNRTSSVSCGDHLDRRVDDLKRSGLGEAEGAGGRRSSSAASPRSGGMRDTWIWRWLDHLGLISAMAHAPAAQPNAPRLARPRRSSDRGIAIRMTRVRAI